MRKYQHNLNVWHTANCFVTCVQICYSNNQRMLHNYQYMTTRQAISSYVNLLDMLMRAHCLPLAEYCILHVRWSLVMGWPLGGGACTTVWPIIATLKCNRTHLGIGYINSVTHFSSIQAVGDWISVPSPNVIAMATRVSPEVQWIADFPQAGAAVPRAWPRVATW